MDLQINYGFKIQHALYILMLHILSSNHENNQILNYGNAVRRGKLKLFSVREELNLIQARWSIN